ncbi:molecular chaperone DnaJ [Massilia sp. DJPM01]|uniref:molecular chaperone DnaJ n=1 Tax=Massilia sp. DJPM01 TaxID=3024404 RepID=UPI00259E6BCB|nr:molecular chaperone DnaJ [Massilia sp. DJPM01]MDM5176271.1 molecular chaperone DnaJ [Massilia sp. DJPM01]
MLLPTQYAIRIAAPAAAGPLSRVRKQFNTLVKKLEAERVRLSLWREELPKIRALADSEYSPLARTFDAHRRRLLLLLDQAYSDKTMGKKDREKLADVICSTALDLMGVDEEDEAIKEIYNKHSGCDFDLDMEAEKAFMRKMVGAATGVELDEDTDFSSPQAFFEAMRDKMEERKREEERSEQSHAAKPAKLSAREARHQAEELKLKQSVRDIFRKLASALHPDRETDSAERGRKTALMQRANVAYASNDLLSLLELQLEVDQIDQTGLDNLGEDRIKQYNRILDGQVGEIKSEIIALETALSLDMGWEFGQHRTPKAMMQGLRADIAAMRANVKYIEADLDTFSDIKKLKAWLKDYRIVANDPGYGEPWF